MSLTAIRAEQLGKRYVLGQALDPHRTFREAVMERAGRAVRRASTLLSRRSDLQAPEAFWALRYVSLDIEQGEAIGLIGGNGAGKSTLLKLLSRITAPTEGQAMIRGRVGSLLEVGTGFHPDLTGRENVFLNGAILGMKRREIERRFDEIVAFAEVARFIDTPVKRFSSGMYLRLAFAVAAHLEPEVLLVDEVLAVGDANFQRKCLGKMGEVTTSGRTVLFVSHNMDAVRRLCPRSILLEDGRIAAMGPSADVIEQHLSRAGAVTAAGEWTSLDSRRRKGSGEARFTAIRYAAAQDAAGVVRPGSEVLFDVGVEAQAALTVASFAVGIRSRSGQILVNADIIQHGRLIRLDRGRSVVRVRIEALHLNPGAYPLTLWMGHGATGAAIDFIESASVLEVREPVVSSLGTTPRDNGFVHCEFSTTVLNANEALE